MKKIIILCLVLISCGFIVYKVSAASATTGLKYTATVSANGQTMQYTVYQKGIKSKMVSKIVTIYSDNTTNKQIVYMPQQNIAVTQQTNPTDNIILDTKTINQYKQSFTKFGSKVISGHTCVIYKNNQGIEACVSEPLGIVLYLKSPANTLTVTSISTSAISDSEFQLPAGVKVQNTNNILSAYATPMKTNIKANMPQYTNVIEESKNMPKNHYNIDFSKFNKKVSATNNTNTSQNFIAKNKTLLINGQTITIIDGNVVAPKSERYTAYLEALNTACSNNISNSKLASEDVVKDLLVNHYNELAKIGVVHPANSSETPRSFWARIGDDKLTKVAYIPKLKMFAPTYTYGRSDIGIRIPLGPDGRLKGYVICAPTGKN